MQLLLSFQRRELHSRDETTVIHAINSIMDLTHDPEKGYEAINLQIPIRMLDLLLSDNKEIRECTCMALRVMAGHAKGAELLATNTKFLENLAAVIEDLCPAVRIKAAALLETLTNNWMGNTYTLVYHLFLAIERSFKLFLNWCRVLLCRYYLTIC